MVHERYRQTDDRQTTDGRATAYSEREFKFTFANKSFTEIVPGEPLHRVSQTKEG